MKILNIIILILLKTTCSFSQNQTMDNNTKQIILKGKKAIIAYTFTIIKEKVPTLEINPKDYEITVWANKTEAIVEFRRLIRYNPLNSGHLRYDITVNLINERVYPFENRPEDSFYVPTKEEFVKIEFVKKYGGIPIKGFDVGVREEKDSYWIGYSNKSNHGGFSIDKITGERSDELQGHMTISPHVVSPLMLPPQTKNQPINKDPLKEIFDIITITDVEKVKQLGRDAIIDFAQQELIKNNINIDPNNYKIRVMANSTTVFVSFHTPITYLPLNSQFYGDIGINIIEKQLSYGKISNPRDFKDYNRKNIPFYKHTEESKKIIYFVLNGKNKDYDPSVEFEFFHDSMIVHEQETYYEVTVFSKYWEESYKVDKVSGKKYDMVTDNTAQQSIEENDEFYEIKK